MTYYAMEKDVLTGNYSIVGQADNAKDAKVLLNSLNGLYGLARLVEGRYQIMGKDIHDKVVSKPQYGFGGYFS